MKKFLALLFYATALLSFAQDKSNEIKSQLTQYQFFKDIDIKIQQNKDSVTYAATFTKNGKSIQADVIDIEGKFYPLFDDDLFKANEVFLEAGNNLDSLKLNNGFLIATDKEITIKRTDLPNKYQTYIIREIDKKDDTLNYELKIGKGFSLVGELSSNTLDDLMTMAPLKNGNQEIILNANLSNTIIDYLIERTKPTKATVESFKLDFIVFNFLPQKDGTFEWDPIIFTFKLIPTGLLISAQTGVTVNGIKNFGFSKEHFILKGNVSIEPDINKYTMDLSGIKKFSKNNLVNHIPAIKLTDVGLNLKIFPEQDAQTNSYNYKFDFTFIGKVDWSGISYNVSFPKTKDGEYQLEFNSLPLGKFYPNAQFPLFKDLFSNIELKNVFLSETYFEADWPLSGAHVPVVGFKQGNDKEYNLAFNFHSLNLKNFLNHEAGFSFPDISLPHNTVAFYIPEVNLSNGFYEIKSLGNIPSIQLKEMFKDNGKDDFPSNGFKLNYGLSFEHFDLTLNDLFGNHFSEMKLDDIFKQIKLSELNITSSTISCKLPINKNENIEIIAFKLPQSPKLNFVFQIDRLSLSDYISGLNGTPLSEIGVFSDFKLISIPSFKTGQGMDVEDAETISFKYGELPDLVKFYFPEFKSKKNDETISWNVGFSFISPKPQFYGSVKEFFDAVELNDFPQFTGSINPEFLFKNWGKWSFSYTLSPGQPAQNNPQVTNDSEFRENFYLSDIPLPGFSIANYELKDPKLSIDGLKFDFPILIDRGKPISKRLKKLVSKGTLAVLVKAKIDIKMPNDKLMVLDDVKILVDKQNKALRLTTELSQDSLVYETDKEGKKKLKETLPNVLFTSDQIDLISLGFDAEYQYGDKNFYGQLSGELFLKPDKDVKKKFEFQAKLHYNAKEKHVTPLFKFFSNEGLSFSDFKSLDLPDPLPKIDHLTVYDIEMAENYFFLGFSPDSIIESNLDSSDYIIAFKAAGQPKFNFGARSNHLITALLHDAPKTIQVKNFHDEKFIFVPKGNQIKDIDLTDYPEKIIKHFNPANKEKLTLNNGGSIQAKYDGTFKFKEIELDMKNVPVGFRVSAVSEGNNSGNLNGLEVSMIHPAFELEGIHFSEDTIWFNKQNDRWNTKLNSTISFEYEGKTVEVNIQAEPFDEDSVYGMRFQSTNNLIFPFPDDLNYLTYDSVSLSGEIERVHEVTKIDLSGNLHLGQVTYKTTAELLKRDGKFKDLVLRLKGDIALKEIPEINTLPDADKITLSDPEISLHHIAAKITYESFSTSGVIFREGTNFALLFGVDSFKLSDIVPNIASDFHFGKTTLSLANNSFSKTVNDLPVAVREYFNDFYNVNDKVDINSGLGLFTAFNPGEIPGDAGKFFQDIGMGQKFTVYGGMGAGLSGISSFTIYASPSSDIKTKGNFAFIQDIKDPKLFIKFNAPALDVGLQAETHVKIGNEKLDFTLSTGLHYEPDNLPGVMLKAQMNGKWYDPMGLDGIELENVSMAIDGSLGGALDIDFKGTMFLEQDSLFFATSIPANGNLTQFGLCATATHLGGQDFAVLADKLSGNKLHLDEIPMEIIAYKDVEIAMVPPFVNLNCSQRISGIDGGGVALKGKGILGNEKLGGTWEVGDVDATAGILSGLSVKGKLNDVDLNIMQMKNTKLDIVAKLEDGKPKSHFKLNGNTDIIGITYNIELILEKDKASFEYDYGLFGFGKSTIKAQTSNGMNFNKDNTLSVTASYTNDINDDFLAALGDEVAKGLNELSDAEKALKDDLNNALADLNEKEKQVESVRDEIIKERKSLEDQLKAAQDKVNELNSKIHTASNNASHELHQSCRRSKKICWHFFGKHCHTFHWTDYSCKAYHYSKYLAYKTEQYSLEAAKVTAVKILEAIQASIDFTPIEADPRMAAPLAALETAKGIYKMAEAAMTASQDINKELADLAEQIKTPDDLKDIFFLKEATLSGAFNAFQSQKDTLNLTLDAIVFGDELSNSVNFTLEDAANAEKIIKDALSHTAHHKVNTVKEEHDKSKYYNPPIPSSLTFYWEKINGQLIDITATEKFIYGIGLSNRLWRLDSNNVWTLIPSVKRFKRLDASNNKIYLIETDNSFSVYYEETGQFRETKSGLGRDIAAGDGNTVYVIGTNNISGQSGCGYIYKSTDEGDSWQIYPGKPYGRQLDVDNNGVIYHAGGSTTVYKWENNKWVAMPGKAKDLYILDNDLWVTGTDNSPWLYETKLYNAFIRANGTVQAMAKLGDNVYSINSNDKSVWVSKMPQQFSGWQKLNEKAIDIASNGNGDLWYIGMNHHAYKLKPCPVLK